MSVENRKIATQKIEARFGRRRVSFPQRRHFERYQPLPEEKRYVSGETYFYLGLPSVQLRIRPIQRGGAIAGVT